MHFFVSHLTFSFLFVAVLIVSTLTSKIKSLRLSFQILRLLDRNYSSKIELSHSVARSRLEKTCRESYKDVDFAINEAKRIVEEAERRELASFKETCYKRNGECIDILFTLSACIADVAAIIVAFIAGGDSGAALCVWILAPIINVTGDVIAKKYNQCHSSLLDELAERFGLLRAALSELGAETASG